MQASPSQYDLGYEGAAPSNGEAAARTPAKPDTSIPEPVKSLAPELAANPAVPHLATQASDPTKTEEEGAAPVPLSPSHRVLAARRRSWLALYLPELALEALYRGCPVSTPVAIVAGSDAHPRVVCANAPAIHAGVIPGMSASAASALAPGLGFTRRDQAAEAAALEGLAVWAGQF